MILRNTKKILSHLIFAYRQDLLTALEECDSLDENGLHNLKWYAYKEALDMFDERITELL